MSDPQTINVPSQSAGSDGFQMLADIVIQDQAAKFAVQRAALAKSYGLDPGNPQFQGPSINRNIFLQQSQPPAQASPTSAPTASSGLLKTAALAAAGLLGAGGLGLAGGYLGSMLGQPSSQVQLAIPIPVQPVPPSFDSDVSMEVLPPENQ